MRTEKPQQTMRKYAIKLAAPLLLALLGFQWAGCDGAIDSAYHEQIVVSGFLFAGSPIELVSVERTTQFGELLDPIASGIDGASVEVIVDGVTHTLQPSSLKGRYFLPSNELTVQGGKTYNLLIVYKGDTVRGATTVPMPIHFIGLSDSLPSRTLVLDTNNLIAFNYGLTAGPIDNPNRKYMLEVSGRDTSFGKIITSQAGPPVDTTANTRYSFLQTAPNIRISPRLFAYYGPNLLTFLAVDTNWVDARRQSVQSTATYQPSLNHIIGGLGTWASGARDTVSVFIKPK